MSLHAVLAGLNDYIGVHNDLSECLNDVAGMAKLLAEREAATVTTLSDGAVTKQGMFAAVLRMFSLVRRGDVTVIQFSGHGTTIPEYGANGKIVKLHQALCPYDFDGTPEHTILDRDFADFIRKHLPAGVACYGLIDACYSGGITSRVLSAGLVPWCVGPVRMKVFPCLITRALAIEAAIAAGVPIIRFADGLVRRGPLAWLAGFFKRLFFGTSRATDPGDNTLPVGLLAAAADGPTYDGTVTPAFLRYHRAHPRASLAEIAQAVARELRAMGISQIVQAEGALRHHYFTEPLQ